MARIRMTGSTTKPTPATILSAGLRTGSEYMLGYCTKFGDNAADIQPIVHLYKTEIFQIAKEMGIPEAIINKPPSAGLWEGQSDEGELGLSYAEIDSSLISLERREWKSVSPVERKSACAREKKRTQTTTCT